MRYFLDLAYRGTAFHGWQVQPNAHTVQSELNHALSTLLRQTISSTGSGRTDTGVHATHQIAHFDTETELNTEDFTYRLNALLPREICIWKIRPVTSEAHARFDATERTYHYFLHKHKDPFKEGISYLFQPSLDVQAIEEGLEVISKWENFQAFSKVHTDVKHFRCAIRELSWNETNDGHVFCVSANRFLRGMVRAIVGTLLEMGQHRLSKEGLIQLLKSENRSNAGRSVPPEGLFLTAISYPPTIYFNT